jgi:SAM-dependent methyltransferase
VIETQMYRLRFSAEEIRQQRAFWAPICRYLENYIHVGGVTLDLGAGYCHFINNVRSTTKYALDLNGDILSQYADPDVRTFTSSGRSLRMMPDASIDTVFASNVYEHFDSRQDVAESFQEVFRVLRPGGRFLIMQPNFAYCSKEYFDFFDHRLAFTHRSIAEGLNVAGFRPIKVISQFLPYTSKSRLPKATWLVELYLKIPLAWKVLGAQMLIVAEKHDNRSDRSDRFGATA